jgi:glycerol-3-phosphate dehydrogenase (NAD(P)+)
MSAPFGVVGAGSFGLGLASAISRAGGEALVWSRSKKDLALPNVRAITDLAPLAACELIFVSVPSMHVPNIAPQLGAHLDGRHLLVHVSRGLVDDDLKTVARYLGTHTPARRVGCLAGPINPNVLTEGVPGGGVVGSAFPEVADAVREAISGRSLRLYSTDDMIGVEVASALVGLLALAVGFIYESKISPSALAVMMSRGLAESARVGIRLGAREDTFHGLAGAGDLYAAIAGDERAEVRLGRALARSTDLEKAGREAGAYIEGLTIARRVARYAARVGIEAPIATVMADVIEGAMSPQAGLERLMSR